MMIEKSIRPAFVGVILSFGLGIGHIIIFMDGFRYVGLLNLIPLAFGSAMGLFWLWVMRNERTHQKKGL